MIERKSFQKTVFTAAAVGAMLFNTIGCSLFSPRVATGGPENANFRQTASVSSNPIPLPVEIVSDITTIASGGNIPQEGVWRPAYPDANVPASDAGAVAPATDEAGNPVAGPVQEVVVNADGTVKESDEESDGETATEGSAKSKGKRRRVASAGGKTESYKVRSGDTLMKISFEKYGNIYRWREIYDTNKSKIANLNKLTAGTLLTIQGVEYIVIERNGTPYLIRRGDTLVKISKNVYNTPTEWKSLWKNNRQLIHDPNKIYAGFTMYYVPKKTDEVPQQVRQISTEKPGVKPKASLPGTLSAKNTKEAPSLTPTVTEPEERTIPGVNLAPTTVTAPAPAPAPASVTDAGSGAAPSAASSDGAWTASPATPMEAPAQAPTAKP